MTLTLDYPPASGGVARYTEALCRHIGADMHVVIDAASTVPDGKGATYRLTQAQLLRASWPRWVPALRLLGQTPQPRALFIQQIHPLGLVAYLHWRKTRTPYVVFLHGMDASLAKRNVWKRFLTKQILQHAHTVVANTQSLAHELTRDYGVHPLVVYPQPGLLVEPPVTRPRAPRVQMLSVARLVERKGIVRTLEVLAASPDLQERVHYTIAGADSPYRATIEATIRQHGLEHCTTLHAASPGLTDTELVALYQAADLFVLPTISSGADREGFGIVYLEAAAAGLPVIASRLPGVDEAVVDQETGILVSTDVELGQAITTLVENTSLREQFGAAGQRRVRECFSPHTVYAELDARLAAL